MNKRQSRHIQNLNPKSIHLQDRDYKILSLLGKYKYLSTSQLHKFCFGSRSKALHRLRQLYDVGLINRIYRPVVLGSSEIIYTLSIKGLDALKLNENLSSNSHNFKIIRKNKSSLFLNHELHLIKFRLLVEEDCQEHLYELLFWMDSQDYLTHLKANNKNSKSSVSIIPDAFLGIQSQKGKSYYFVEMDMGSENLSRIEKKIDSYISLLTSGQFESNWGYKRFRVLFITTSQVRMTNILRIAQKTHNYAKLFWGTTFNQTTIGLNLPQWLSANILKKLQPLIID